MTDAEPGERRGGTPQEYFDALYRDADDPFGYADSWYEQRKYRLLLATLPRPRYEVTFEPACSVGVLTALLAARTDRLHACDRAGRAVDLARRRLDAEGVTAASLRVGDARDPWPEATCDLLVVSEFAYYEPPTRLPGLVAALAGLVAPGGDLVSCHWRGRSPDHRSDADEVRAAFDGVDGLTRTVRHDDPDFLLDVHRREGGRD